MRKYPLTVWSPEEIDQVLAAAGKTRNGRRNRALVALLAGTALRCAEALALELADIDLQRGTVQVRNGKNAKHRTVGISDSALSHLRDWLSVRGIAPGLVFQTYRGAPIQSSYVRRLLPRLASRAGYEKRLHAHALRRSLAYRLHRDGVPLAVLQKALGHSNVATTSVYIDDGGSSEVIDAMRKAG